jgi:lysylphosphatidylglycerol synthetase-like protein (DUF2156 family)
LSTQISNSIASPTLRGFSALHRPAANDTSRLDAFAFQYGASYDSYLAVEPDRQVFWSREVPGAATYVRSGRYVHVGGGLLAPAGAKSLLLAEMIRWADRERLVLSFYNLTDDDLPLVRGAGFQVTKWGEEAIVDLTECTWSGKPYEWLRRQSSFCRGGCLSPRAIAAWAASKDFCSATPASTARAGRSKPIAAAPMPFAE